LQALGLRKSDSKVVRGMKGREKVVEVSGAAGVEVQDVVKKLEELVED
jgi:hypothetical protein